LTSFLLIKPHIVAHSFQEIPIIGYMYIHYPLRIQLIEVTTHVTRIIDQTTYYVQWQHKNDYN